MRIRTTRAYKLRKGVRFDFVDFGTGAERAAGPERMRLSTDLPGWSEQLDELVARLRNRASETKP